MLPLDVGDIVCGCIAFLLVLTFSFCKYKHRVCLCRGGDSLGWEKGDKSKAGNFVYLFVSNHVSACVRNACLINLTYYYKTEIETNHIPH